MLAKLYTASRVATLLVIALSFSCNRGDDKGPVATQSQPSSGIQASVTPSQPKPQGQESSETNNYAGDLKNSNDIAMKADESAKNEGNNSVVVDKVSTYYPLNVGDTWFYEGPFNKAGNPIGTGRVEVISYSDKYNAYLIESIEKIADISTITDQKIIEVRGNSVLELAQGGGLLGSEIKRHEMPIIVLQAPLKIGKKWVKYSQATEKETCEVVGLLPSYTVKAGSFENVWKISCPIYLQDKKTGKMEFWNGTYDYYAPEVGLIKREIIKTGSTFSELLEYKIK